MPALTFVATANAPRYTGAAPVLCDVESPERPNLAAAAVERCLSPRTRAVIAVHFCGYAVDLGPLRELCDARGIALVEDAAQAIGAELEPGRQAGTVGALGCLSFFSEEAALRRARAGRCSPPTRSSPRACARCARTR